MLGNYEKMLPISSPPSNHWPQINQQLHEKTLMASKPTPPPPPKLMEKPNQQISQPQSQNQQQHPLKCPRCDSSNTKFCYYNNYSLSQPRHFCKACKRYWTRGGTLRNVPVGGGCRKNKRVKRPSSTSSSSTSIDVSSSNPDRPSQTQMDISPSTNPNHLNPLFYGLPSNINPSDHMLNLTFPRFSSRSVSNIDTVSQFNALGLGFSSGLLVSATTDDNITNTGGDQNHVITSNSVLSSNFPLLSSSSSSQNMASLLASNFQQQKFINGGAKTAAQLGNNFHNILPFGDLQINSNGEEAKDVKVEEGQTRMDWNQMDQQMGLSDPHVYWNSSQSSVSAWHDSGNIGSSVTSLI